MRLQFLGLAMMAVLTACGSQEANEPATETAETADAATPSAESDAAPAAETSAAPAAEATAASASEPPFAVKKGDRLEVTRQAECFEVGPDADDFPWQMGAGVTVKYVSAQDGKARVIGASGDECVIDWDVLKPTS